MNAVAATVYPWVCGPSCIFFRVGVRVRVRVKITR
jgi:hypothetical protein